MTNAVPLKMSLQSDFHFRDDNGKLDRVSLDDKERDQIKDCADAGRSISEMTLPTSSLSSLPSSSLPAKDASFIRRLQLKLDSATLKVEKANELADIALFRVRDRVIQSKDNILEIAVAIDEHNADESRSIKQIENIEKEKKLKYDTELKVTTKRKEKLLRLEKVKIEVLDFTTEKRRALKWVMIYQKIIKDQEETLTFIRKDETYFTIGDDKEDNLALKKDDEGGLEENHADLRGDIQILTICKLLNCTQEELYDSSCSDSFYEPGMEMLENSSVDTTTVQRKITDIIQTIKEELYDSHFTDSSFEPIIEMMENSSADTTTVQRIITGLVQIIEEYDNRLSDIELMQSIIFAENAALKGNSEFKFDAEGEQCCDMNKDYSFSPVDEYPTQKVSPWSGFGGVSKNVRLTMKTFRLAASKVDKHRRDQKIE